MQITADHHPSSGEVPAPHGSAANGQALDVAAVLNALAAVKRGDFSARLPIEWTGIAGKVSDTFNDVIALNERMAGALARVTRLVHHPLDRLSERNRRTLELLRDSERMLAGKKVLILDDDIRNIFTMTSVLERYQMHTVAAENGRDAIRTLQSTGDIDIVLMDMMMPEMDGLDTTREIRKISDFKDLPIIAVTAKAMKGDREKCIEAGAWDDLAKPVDTEQTISVLRAWLHRRAPDA